MKHGFKTHAKKLAIELRQEIDLDAHQPFAPYQLAELYGIQVVTLSELDCSDAAHQHFGVAQREVFSGALIPNGTGAVMLENDAHPLVRRRSTASHELAHVCLEHVFAGSLVNEKGCRSSDPEQEDEATELAAELLVPTVAAQRLGRETASDEAVAEHFNVSIEMARWRMRMSGARIMAARRSAAYRRKMDKT